MRDGAAPPTAAVRGGTDRNIVWPCVLYGQNNATSSSLLHAVVVTPHRCLCYLPYVFTSFTILQQLQPFIHKRKTVTYRNYKNDDVSSWDTLQRYDDVAS